MRHALLLILYMLRESRRGHTPSQNSDDGRSVEAVTEHVSEQFTRYVELYGLATDRRVFDHIDAGLQPGEMFVIAGCPGTGKASLMLSLVGDFCSHQQVPTLVFSGRMTTFEFMQRLVFERARVSLSRFYQGIPLAKLERRRILMAVMELTPGRLSVDDTPGLSIESLRAKARRAVSDDDTELIVIDGLHSLKSDTTQAAASGDREIAAIAAGIKSLALELDIPILVLADLKPPAGMGRTIGLHPTGRR